MTTTERAYAYPEAGDVIDGKYRIDGYIGEGGMGAVARAWHTLRKAPVALKFMAPHLAGDAAAVERFMNEAVAASQLKSEHIVQVFDVGKLPGGSPYLVLEFLEGRDAASLVETEGATGLEIPRAAHIVFQVLRGLEIAHAAGIIHRDLKPSNCFLIPHESDPEFVKLLDFGISKIQREGSASITATNTALGTPLYMSPEQARSARDVDLRCDIYSTGVILYELLCGSAPHMVEGGEFAAVLFRLFTTDAPLITEKRPGLPEPLVKVVHKALEREPEKRFASARDFADALAPFCDGRSAIEIARFRAAQTHVVSLAGDRVRIQSQPNFDSTDSIAATHLHPSSDAPPMLVKPAPSLEKPEPSVAKTDLSGVSEPLPTAESAPTSRRGIFVGAGLAVAVLCVVAAVATRATSHGPTTPTHDPIVTASTPVASVTTPVVIASVVPSVVPTESAAPSATTAHTAPATSHSGHVHLNTVTVIQ